MKKSLFAVQLVSIYMTNKGQPNKRRQRAGAKSRARR
jgi:hypothetical protein